MNRNEKIILGSRIDREGDGLNIDHIICELMIKNISSFRISELENMIMKTFTFPWTKITSPFQRNNYYPFQAPVLYRTLSTRTQAKFCRVPNPQVKIPCRSGNCTAVTSQEVESSFQAFILGFQCFF